MKFYSTNKQSPEVDFKQATLKGIPLDKGLYFPERVPQIENKFFQDIEKYSNAEIAYRIISPYVSTSIPTEVLKQIVEETIDFDIPLVKVSSNIFSLELFHGPTLAFKDIGARFMSRCLGYFAREKSDKVVVLVATSGDTGGAVANGFYNIKGVEVVILYPSGKVSNVQEKQLTTLGNNIHALEVEGNFDDCQAMVKAAFADEELNKMLFLTSANSINVARWLPQQFYYFFAWKQWIDKAHPPVISVPSGNFGNICAGLLSKRSGLPVSHFIAACNANDTVTQYFEKGKYDPKKAVATISNAMDVGDPSNFVRIMEMFAGKLDLLNQLVTSYSISDDETRAAIKNVFQNQNYLLDPHGAVAWVGLKKYLQKQDNKRQGIFLGTAHPVKFYDVVEPVIQQKVLVPTSIQVQVNQEKRSLKIPSDNKILKDFLKKMK
ncbi:MAG: threonine synthase [Ferruginibacter sp.]